MRTFLCLLATFAIPQTSPAAAPYPPSDLVVGIHLDWSTHQRHAQGSDNFQLTWADDDHLYGPWGDGGGLGGTNSRGRVGLGIARIEGDATDYRGFNVWGGCQPENPAQFDGKSWAIICIDGTLYMWVVPDRQVLRTLRPLRRHPSRQRPGLAQQRLLRRLSHQVV